MRNLDEPLTFQVERTEESSAGQIVSCRRWISPCHPTRCNELGMEMQIGRIHGRAQRESRGGSRIPGRAIGSPTCRAEEVGDPMILSQRMRKWIGQEVQITVERKSRRRAEERWN